MIDLNELLRNAGSIILVDVLGLEFLCPDDLLEWWSQSTEIVPP
jgi:hypothetical protein